MMYNDVDLGNNGYLGPSVTYFQALWGPLGTVALWQGQTFCTVYAFIAVAD